MTDIELPRDFNISAYKHGRYDHLMTGKKWRLTCTDYGHHDVLSFRKALLNKSNNLGLKGQTVIINEKELFFHVIGRK